MTDPLLDLGQELARARAAALEMPNIDFHTGQIIAWDSTNFTNQILVLGTLMENLPILTAASTSGLVVGASVGILRVKTQYFILGRIVEQSSGLVNPQFPIVLYPQFANNLVPGAGIGYNRVDVGVLAYWEGRIKVSFPFIEVDGIWGIASGVGSVTYDVRVNLTQVGTWTINSGLVAQKFGPFDVSQFLGFDWLLITVGINASSGTGERAIQPVACYFSDS